MTVSKERSRNMAAIKARDTKPEMAVRRFLHRSGLRYRLHRKDLPGKPDLVFPLYKAVVFVHGCFWHRHKGCSNSVMPKSNREFWREKLGSNVERDRRNVAALTEAGWRVFIVWECEISEQKLEQLRAGIVGSHSSP